MSPAELCQRSAAYLLDGLSHVTADDLARPTPCPGWDLRTLLRHVSSSADGLAGVAEPAEADPVDAARASIRRLRDVVRGSATHDAGYGGAIELAAHGWDVHASLGTDIPIPEEHATAVLALATTLVDEEARTSFFGPAVAAEGSAADRLVAFLGREPWWTVPGGGAE